MLTVHHLGVSQSDRIVWLCEELGISYDLVRYDRDQKTRLAPADYRALHPIGTAPVISDGDILLAESAAIIEYIIARHGGGRLAIGKDSPAFADYLFWFYFANGSMMPASMIEMVVSRVGDEAGRMFAGLTDRVERNFAMVEARLGETPYFAGDAFSAADILMLFPLTTMRVFSPRDMSGYPNILAYLQRIGERPAYRRAMAKADPDLAPLLS